MSGNSECEHQATQKGNLVRHQQAVHMGQQFQCPECEHQANQKGDLIRHQQSVHSSEIRSYAPEIPMPRVSISGKL